MVFPSQSFPRKHPMHSLVSYCLVYTCVYLQFHFLYGCDSKEVIQVSIVTEKHFAYSRHLALLESEGYIDIAPYDEAIDNCPFDCYLMGDNDCPLGYPLFFVDFGACDFPCSSSALRSHPYSSMTSSHRILPNRPNIVRSLVGISLHNGAGLCPCNGPVVENNLLSKFGRFRI